MSYRKGDWIALRISSYLECYTLPKVFGKLWNLDQMCYSGWSGISFGMCNIWKGQAQRSTTTELWSGRKERERFSQAQSRRTLKSKTKWKWSGWGYLCVKKESEGNCFCEWEVCRYTSSLFFPDPPVLFSSHCLKAAGRVVDSPRHYNLICFSKEEVFCFQLHFNAFSFCTDRLFTFSL